MQGLRGSRPTSAQPRALAHRRTGFAVYPLPLGKGQRKTPYRMAAVESLGAQGMDTAEAERCELLRLVETWVTSSGLPAKL